MLLTFCGKQQLPVEHKINNQKNVSLMQMSNIPGVFFFVLFFERRKCFTKVVLNWSEVTVRFIKRFQCQINAVLLNFQFIKEFRFFRTNFNIDKIFPEHQISIL